MIVSSMMLELAGRLLFLSFIVRPINQLSSTMVDFRDDHFEGNMTGSQKAISSDDEIDTLTATFYRMLQHIQTQMREIEKTREGHSAPSLIPCFILPG